jgi:hypothetical protein
MTRQFDLEADTGWIRRAAATLDQTARGFLYPADLIGAPGVGDGSLGRSAEAGAAVRLINLRSGQAADAAAQLSAISTGLAGKLRVAADQMDLIEAAIGLGHK